MQKRHLIIVGSLCLLAMASNRSEAVVTYVTTLSPGGALEPQIDQTGTIIAALNFGGNSLTDQGIAFTGTGSSTGPFTVGAQTYNFGPNSSSLAFTTVGPNPLFETEIYTLPGGNPSPPQTLLISGLDPAKTYQVQYLHGDTRPIENYGPLDQTYTDSVGQSVTVPLVFGIDTFPYVVQIVTVAGSTSLTTTMSPAFRGPSYSGLVVSVIPEPTTLMLAAFGGLAMSCSRQRRILTAVKIPS